MSQRAKPDQVWVLYKELEWEFSSIFENGDPTALTLRELVLEALKVFRLDAIAEPLARLSYNGAIQPLKNNILDYGGGTLEFELILAHHATQQEVYKTRYFSPLHDPLDCSTSLSEIIYIKEDCTLAVNGPIVQELELQANNKEYVPAIGTLGNTGTGKSLILTALLDRQENVPPTRKADQNGSTTANVNIFRKVGGANATVYLDFEGENGTVPQALPQHRFWRHLNRIDESSRRRIVHKLLPKLAYVLCDVIIFCTTDELSSDFSVYDRCIAFAQRANSKLKETDRPALVVVHNKFPVSMGNFNSELDVETSSSYFLNTFDPEGELRGLFSACKVVRLPLLSQIHDSGILRSLWDQQIDRLNETIRSLSMERYESRKKFLMGYQLTETSWYKILPKILHDLCAKEEISLARYLLELCQEKMQDKIKLACDLFKCLCESKDQRTVEWYSECASIAVDTLARSWGTTQFEQGLLVDNEAIIQQADVLKPFIEYFNQMRPCTATFVYKKKTYQCLQSQALHDHHRTVVKKTGVRGKMLELLNLRKVTRTWEGNFQCNEMDYQRTRKQLEKQFCTLALAFARQDEETLKEFFTDVFRGPRYTNTIWNAFRESRTDKTLKLWAIELTQYCMKAKHLDRSINLWELATGESGSRPQYFSYLLNVIPVENIKLSENVLGRGAFGTVYSGTFTDASGNEIECAVKVIDENSGVFDLTGFYREVTILSVISHPRLVKFHGGSRTKEKQFYLVQQKLDTDLETWTEQNPSPSVSELLRIIEDIAEGISVIHSFTVVHRDITPANILLKRDKDSWRAFLADFGISRAVSIQNMTRYTPNKQFCAPELVNAEVWYCDYTLAVDVYSFGMIMDWLLLHCKPKDKGLETFVEQIQFLVAQCTQNDPQRRPPIVAALLFLEDLNSLLAKNATQEMQII